MGDLNAAMKKLHEIRDIWFDQDRSDRYGVLSDLEAILRAYHGAVPDPDFEVAPALPEFKVGYLVPSGIPDSPSPSSPCPPTRLSAEGYVGPQCPICHSDMKRKWFIVGPLLGCINEDCRNYWKRKGVMPPKPWPPPKSSLLEEGMVRKGGLGSKPNHPPPPSPKGQRPAQKE